MGFHHQNHFSVYSIINHHLHQLAHIHSLCRVNELLDNLIWKRNLHSLFLMPTAGLPRVRMPLCTGLILTGWRLLINEPLQSCNLTSTALTWNIVPSHSSGMLISKFILGGGKKFLVVERWLIWLQDSSILSKYYLIHLKIILSIIWASQVAQMVKNPPVNSGDLGSIPGWGRCLGEGNVYPLQYSCLENPMDRGVWQALVNGVANSGTRQSD